MINGIVNCVFDSDISGYIVVDRIIVSIFFIGRYYWEDNVLVFNVIVYLEFKIILLWGYCYRRGNVY